MSIKRHARTKLHAGMVTTASTMSELSIHDLESQTGELLPEREALSTPLATAPAAMAHCNVIMANGSSPCFPSSPIGHFNPGGPIKLVSA
jgi:hypothetical protein